MYYHFNNLIFNQNVTLIISILLGKGYKHNINHLVLGYLIFTLISFDRAEVDPLPMQQESILHCLRPKAKDPGIT